MPSKTVLSQTSSDSMICLSDSDYVKVVNGLIRLQELDTLYKISQEKVANLDSQIANYEQVVANSDTIISRYEGLTDSLKVNLYLVLEVSVSSDGWLLSSEDHRL